VEEFFKPEESLSIDELEQRLGIKTAAWESVAEPALRIGGQALRGAWEGAQGGAVLGGLHGAWSGGRESVRSGNSIVDVLRDAAVSGGQGALSGAAYGAGIGAVVEPVAQHLSHPRYNLPVPGARAVNTALGKGPYTVLERNPTAELVTADQRLADQYRDVLDAVHMQRDMTPAFVQKKMQRLGVPTPRWNEVYPETMSAGFPARIAGALGTGWLTMRSIGKAVARKKSVAGGDVDTTELKVTDKYWEKKGAAKSGIVGGVRALMRGFGEAAAEHPDLLLDALPEVGLVAATVPTTAVAARHLQKKSSLVHRILGGRHA